MHGAKDESSAIKHRPLINVHGVRFRTLTAFLALAAIVIALLWLLQVVFLNSYYEGMKKKEVERIGAKIVSAYGAENYGELINEMSFKNEITILVFTLTTEGTMTTVNVIYTSGGRLGQAEPIRGGQVLADFINRFNTSDTVSYIASTTGVEELKTVTYGKRIISENDEEVYFYVNSSVTPVDSTVDILRSQLIIITLICIFVSIVMSTIVADRLTKPLVDLSASAKKLADGDLDVVFEGNGYEEVERLSETLNYATGELKKTDKLRADVIANVSHELRTPLTMIKAYAELIRDISGDNPDKRNENLSVILDEVDRLKVLVDDILDLSKLQAGVAIYDMQDVDLSQLVLRQVSNFGGIFEQQGFTFTADVDDGVIVNCDERRINQVVFNLLNNAVNYSTDEKVISVSLKPYDKAAQSTAQAQPANSDNPTEEKYYRLEVRDRGVGIAKEDIENIFDRFFRTEQTKRTKTGSGIGLSLVKSILTAHKFEFGVESEIGKGSTFFVVFPCRA